MYEAVSEAIISSLRELGEIEFTMLRREVEARTPRELWESASVGWYTTAVKLDLEARGTVERRRLHSRQYVALAG